MEDEKGMAVEPAEKNYFDTCTVIDIIDDNSRYHSYVIKAVSQIRGKWVFSEYMENELKSVLRHAERFSQRKDVLLNNYSRVKQNFNPIWVPISQQIASLHNYCRISSRRVRIKFQDMVHIGICSLENIINIISDDWHISMLIEIVKQELSHFYSNISNPKHVYTTRQGYIKSIK
ncbi:MAG: hypothetical protein ACP5IT_07500 [Thermoproteota archaeon]|jgi:hypothetical protein